MSDSIRGCVFNIQRFSTDDGDGIRTVVFLKGCPLDCPWCHNPEGKSASPELAFYPSKCIGCGECFRVCENEVHTMSGGTHVLERKKCTACGKCAKGCPAGALALFGKAMSVSEVIGEVQRDRVYYGETGGITLSGGEPLFQPKFAAALLSASRASGINTCVETSGFCKTETLQRIMPFTDAFLFDIKHTDSVSHKRLTGVPLEVILKNLDCLCSAGASVTLRCPFIPGQNDSEEHWLNVGRTAQKYDSITAVQLMPYHPAGLSKAAATGIDARFTDTAPAEKEAVSAAAGIISRSTTKKVVF